MTQPSSLAASLRADQRSRWERGDSVRVEAYLEKFPSLHAEPQDVLDLLYNEWLLRREKGEDPQASEYAERFGSMGAQFQEMLQAPRTQYVSAPSLPRTAGPDVPTGEDMPRLPGYEVLRELGRGGMGVVYLARQSALKRLVALKMILAGPRADETARARFRTEAEAVARLRHPHIVQIYEVGEHDGRPYFSLEYLEGGSLQERADGKPLPEREAALLVETLARAMHHAHEQGIIHRDLKPGNILLAGVGGQGSGVREEARYAACGLAEPCSFPSSPLTPDPRPPTPAAKITDFGLAKLLDADGGFTRTEALIGTPSYMAPEQAAGDARKVGVPADVYSLGAILYELLTGHAPFTGPTVLTVLEQVRTREPVAPRRWQGRLAPDLETICLRCLEKDPDRRYESAHALADDLRRYLDGQPVLARPVGPCVRLWRAARRRPAAVARVLGAVALVCLVLAGWSYWRAEDHLARGRAEQVYQQFVRRRDDALFYGLLAPDQGALFLGAAAEANLRTAEAAAREALDLAGVDLGSGPGSLSGPRQADLAPDCYALLLVLASVRGQQALDGPGRAREALGILDRAARLGIETRAYHLRRAHFLERTGERDEARRERERAEAVPVEGALDHFLVGEEQYRRGDWKAATESFDHALGREPGHFWAQFFLAVCHLKSQHWEAARVGLNACLTRQPGFVWAYLFRSFAHEKLGELGEAEADFEKALGLDPDADARYVLYLTRGILHFNQKDLGRAGADFRAAWDLKPDQYNAYLNLAQVHLARKEFAEAEEQVARAVRLGPPALVLFGYHVERARNLLHDRQYEEAVRECEAAHGLAPDQPQPHEVRARALLELGRYDQAEWWFDRHLRQGGEATPEVWCGRGRARMQLGKYPEAAEDYTRALERAPEAEVYQHRGWAHFFADAWKLALRDFDKALELAPESADARTGRGLARVMLGEYRTAVADAVEALRRQPDTPEMMHNLACVFAQAAARAEADPALGQGGNELANDYRGRALVLIGQTLALVAPAGRAAFWRDKVFPDPALAPLHNEPEFRRLQKEYGGPR